MFIGNNKQKYLVENFYNIYKNKIELEILNKKETLTLANCINENYVNNSVLDVNACEIDVNNLYEYYRKNFKQNNGHIITDLEVSSADYINDKWIS